MIKKALKDMCQHSMLSHIVEEQFVTHRNHCSYIDAVTHGYSHYLANRSLLSPLEIVWLGMLEYQLC